MDDRFSDQLIRAYIAGVRSKGTLDDELVRVQTLLIQYTKYPCPDKETQRCYVSRTNQLFRALLDLKESLPKQTG